MSSMRSTKGSGWSWQEPVVALGLYSVRASQSRAAA